MDANSLKHDNLEILNKKIEKLHKALSFYADDETHIILTDENGFLITEYIKDNGQTAKNVLAEIEQ